MFSFLDKGLCPIGIDVGAHAVRMLQFRASADGLSLQDACRIEIDSLGPAASGVLGGARAAAAVAHGLANRDFAGRRVVLSLPASSIHAKSIRLPQMPDSDLNQALQWEAKDRFGFEVGDASATGGQLVWFRVGEVRRGTEVKDELLLFAAEGAVLTDYIQALSALDLEFAGIDIPPCAIDRSIRRTLSGGSGLAGAGAVLDIGHAGSQFFITHGGELVFYKFIDMGARALHEAVAAKLGISVGEAIQMRSRLIGGAAPEESAGAPDSPPLHQDAAPLGQALRDAMRAPLEELARELDMCMRYYVVTFRGARPETLLLAGRQASCSHTRDILASALSLQVDEAQPLRGVQDLRDAARPDRSGEWSIAAGLSLYPVGVRALAEAAA